MVCVLASSVVDRGLEPIESNQRLWNCYLASNIEGKEQRRTGSESEKYVRVERQAYPRTGLFQWSQGRLQVHGKGAREDLVGDCGLVFPGVDPGFQVIGGAFKNVSPSEARRENFWGILCEKSRFYANNHIFSNFFFGGGAPPFESDTGSGSDNNST